MMAEAASASARPTAGVKGFGFRVLGSGFWFQFFGGFRAGGLGFGIYGLGFGVWGLGFGVWGLGFGVWDLGSRVWGLGFRI